MKLLTNYGNGVIVGVREMRESGTCIDTSEASERTCDWDCKSITISGNTRSTNKGIKSLCCIILMAGLSIFFLCTFFFTIELIANQILAFLSTRSNQIKSSACHSWVCRDIMYVWCKVRITSSNCRKLIETINESSEKKRCNLVNLSEVGFPYLQHLW